MDRIELYGLRAHGYHGVFEHERQQGQEFVVDLVLHLDTRAAGRTGDLDRTVHYGVVAGQVHDVVTGEPVDLIETLAARIADTVLSHAAVGAVDVAVHKPQAPIEVPFDDVVLRIHREREES
ncbi:MAG: dihydroneopterin aldolase [Actinomycetes bacterium]